MKLLLFTIISLCFLNVKAQNFRLPTDVQQHQLNGKVKKVKEIIAQTGATTMKDMGRVMGMASKQMAGLADGGTISAIVKRLLA